MPEAGTFDPAELVRQASAAGTWTLDTSASRVEFVAKSFWGLATIRGHFARVTGSAQVAESGQVTAELVIDAASVDTKQAKRDTHLRSADFFHVEAHPNIAVKVGQVVFKSATAATAHGQVQAAGHEQPISFDATIAAQGTEATVETTIELDRSSLGMTWNPLGMAKPKATVHATLVFRAG